MYIAIKQIGRDLYDVVKCDDKMMHGKVVATFTDWHDASYYIDWKENNTNETSF